jgi:hypothetical protein
MENLMKGICLCGSVSVEVKDMDEFEACHCGMCRRWGGGPFLAIHCGSDIGITGSDAVKTYDSSDWAERAFCENCGSHLYYRLKPSNEYTVSLGLFDLGESGSFKQQIFIDKKPRYYAFSNQTEMLTEKQVFEKYGAE